MKKLLLLLMGILLVSIVSGAYYTTDSFGNQVIINMEDSLKQIGLVPSQPTANEQVTVYIGFSVPEHDVWANTIKCTVDGFNPYYFNTWTFYTSNVFGEDICGGDCWLNPCYGCSISYSTTFKAPDKAGDYILSCRLLDFNAKVLTSETKTFSVKSAVTCTDTDAGEDYYTKGTVTYGGVPYTDYCVSSVKLKEYFCDEYGEVTSIIPIKEGYECKDGRLVEIQCIPHYEKKCSGGDVYWYDSCGEQEEIYDDCGVNEFCENGVCKSQQIECSSNLDCGTNGLTGNKFCSGNVVYQKYVTYTCNNPGTAQSYCSQTDSDQLIKDCGAETCINGECISPVCTMGETKTETCPDGSTIITHNCVNDNWVETGNTCPPPCTTGDTKEETCEDGRIIVTHNCVDEKWVETGEICEEEFPLWIIIVGSIVILVILGFFGFLIYLVVKK